MSSGASDDSYVRTAFLERLAHELRGPAGVTVGALDEIERALGADAEKLRAQFAMARRGVSRVVRAADRLQRTAQLERGDATFDMATVDVRPIAEKAAAGAQAIEARRKITVEVKADDSPCTSCVDAEWLQNAIAEIVGNAIRFARTQVSVETRSVGAETRITIRDDGPGFSKAPSLRRFEAPLSGGGLGLSLPLVRAVLDSHHGRLELSPPATEGATGSGGAVTLILPAHPSLESAFAR